MKRLGVIGGAGGLGSTMAFYLGLKELFDEIVLLDVKANLLETHCIDLRECFSGECATRVVMGNWEQLAGCDLIIMAAAVIGQKVQSRNEYLAANLKVITATAQQLKKYCPETPLITCTAPVDVFNMVFNRLIGGDHHHFLGFCLNDSLRFRWAVAHTLGLDGRRVGGLVLGEHGDSQVPIFSTITVDGEPHQLKQEERAQVEKILAEWYPHWQSLDTGRTTTWTSATSIGHTIEKIFSGQSSQVMASAILTGEYGFKDISLGLPVKAGPYGWTEVIEIPLTREEKDLLATSAKKIRSLYEQTL